MARYVPAALYRPARDKEKNGKTRKRAGDVSDRRLPLFLLSLLAKQEDSCCNYKIKHLLSFFHFHNTDHMQTNYDPTLQ